MPYREESEALRAKVESLQAELEEKERALDAVEPELQRVEALERALAHAHARLIAPALQQRRAQQTLFALSVVSCVALTTVSGLMSFAASWRDHHAPRYAPATATIGAYSPSPFSTPIATPFSTSRRARVTDVEGPAPTYVGAECEVQVERAFPESGFDATVRVECAGRTLYGRPGFGYLSCREDDGVPARCEDRRGTGEDGDAMVVVDLPTHAAVVRDGPELPWTVRLELDGPPVE